MVTSNPRQQDLAGVKSVVVKLGTQLLSTREGRLDEPFLSQVAAEVADLRQRGLEVTLVSSGAIGAGLKELNLPRRPKDLGQLQAVAAVGQRRLMDAWAQAFTSHSLPVAQVLLTREDVDRRTRFLNLRNTLRAVHGLNAVPIINENDTISTHELVRITFGDNDILAALTAQAIQADLLVLLTVVDGVMDDAGKSLRRVEAVDSAASFVRKEKSAMGKGGMNSKLEAARMVTSSGSALVVANGRTDRVLHRILAAEEIGTLFVPRQQRRSARSGWMNSARPVGTIVVDAGAVTALVQRNRSLLPAGVVRVEGDFRKGDLVAIKGPDGMVVARGLSNYPASVVLQIRGRKSSEIRARLGAKAYEEVVHRDNLVIDAG